MRWLRTMKGLLVVLLALGANAGCDTLDCFDGAGLEAKYNEGTDRAHAVNTQRYEEGKAYGLSLTRVDGERDGARDGYDAGFTAGYNSYEGYLAGYDDAYDDGLSDGASDPSACSEGSADGYAAGGADGYDDAYGDGYSDGYSDGTEAGASDGEAACEYPEIARTANQGTNGPLATVKDRMKSTASTPPQTEEEPVDTVDPEEARVCYSRGYDDHHDEGAYASGVSEGKRLNVEYQAGYRSTYDAAYTDGEIDGIGAGYAEGALDGYDDGYADGAGAVYDGCYADGYDAGYADGGGDGYDSGYSDGFDSGYNDAWDSVICG